MTTPETADSRTLRISRVPSKPVRRQKDGRYAIPLWLQQAGRFDGDVDLRLTPSEAELLHAQLCFALDDWPRTVPADATTPGMQETGTRQPRGQMALTGG